MPTPVLTILTPTWNRRHLLPRLYASLISQEAREGSTEWLVVDDGSTDGTAAYICGLVEESPFPIRLIRQKNGGKHRAVNRATQEIVSPWLLVVDSDDWLLPDSIHRTLAEISAAEPDPSVHAIIAPRHFGTGKTTPFPITDRTISFSDLYGSQIVCDTSIIMRTSTLRAYPFPEFEGEMFVAESSVYARAFRNGGIRLSNVLVVGAAYQEDGLTARALSLRCNNPLGCLYTYRAQIEAGLRGRKKLRSLLNYHRFYWHAVQQTRSPQKSGFTFDSVWLLPGATVFLYDQWQLWRNNRP